MDIWKILTANPPPKDSKTVMRMGMGPVKDPEEYNKYLNSKSPWFGMGKKKED